MLTLGGKGGIHGAWPGLDASSLVSGDLAIVNDYEVVVRGLAAMLQNDGDGTHAVGWLRPGEWLEYTVNVPAAGNFSLAARVVSAVNTGAFRVEVDGAIVDLQTVEEPPHGPAELAPLQREHHDGLRAIGHRLLDGTESRFGKKASAPAAGGLA